MKQNTKRLTSRSMTAALPALGLSVSLFLYACGPGGDGPAAHGPGGKPLQGAGRDAHAGYFSGSYGDDPIGIDPTEYLSTWNFNNLPPGARNELYRETRLEDGRRLREYWISAVNREIEIAPGIIFPAWTYNGQVPGPTIRATEGDIVRVHFTNNGDHPHTIHFHGFHPAEMDGALPEDFVPPGGTFLYEFEAEPAGLHLYHCHSTPLTRHIHKGLYGVYIVDPKQPRSPARELVMMMNGFDTNFDGDNEVYAVNTTAFYYMDHPIQVRLGDPVRIYLVNILEFDETNSFHVHGHFFSEYRTGILDTPHNYTDTITMGQAERSVLEMEFRFPGKFMFHAHKTEFAELGWMGLFEVVEPTEQ